MTTNTALSVNAQWWRTGGLILRVVSILIATFATAAAGLLEQLSEPQDGRSMRVTWTMRVGELRPGDRQRVPNPQTAPKGDFEEASNRDNFRIAPGATQVLMDERGPGIITHIWLTFLGPEPKLYR